MNAIIHAPELGPGLAWLNTDRPLRFAHELRGQVVLLDFWTYCCINCMHILPDLEQLEQAFAAHPFVVIGVHSAKFDNETDPAGIRAAVQRYGIRHPVVVDEDMRLWRAYGARSWPTRVLVDPTGTIVASIAGEGRRDELQQAIAALLEQHGRAGTLAAAPPVVRPDGAVRSGSGLAFPGKVLAGPEADASSRRLFVADTGHHRIVVASWPERPGAAGAPARARLLQVIGTGEPGRDDGPAERASFRSPQGLAVARGRLFVADTGNHLIRAVDLASGEVTTWAGTGEMTNDRTGGGRGPRQGLNSPWDLAVHGSRLLVAMAGTHQVWRFELGNALGRAYAGTGREDLQDGPAEEAALAQPSGLAVAGDRLWIADSEVSAVRGLDLVDERVFTVIGEGLFDFGDVDGAWPTARLQHPLGVAWWNGCVLVADSYNHKIKAVEPGARVAATRLGDGRAGADDGRGGLRLFEPGGLSVAGDELLIADTNNHRVVWADLAGAAWHEVAIEGLEPPARSAAGAAAAVERDEELPPLTLRRAGGITLAVDADFAPGFHANPEAPVTLRVRVGDRVIVQQTRTGMALPVVFALPEAVLEPGTWRVEVGLVACADGDVARCVPVHRAWRVPVLLAGTGEERLELRLPVSPD